MSGTSEQTRPAQAAAVETIQLRRYRIAEGRIEDFLRSWQAVIPALRQRHGFEIRFAYLDREHRVFAWAVAVAGDRSLFLARERAYYESPERQALAQHGDASVLEEMSIGFVDSIGA